jgi:hypothetical protein
MMIKEQVGSGKAYLLVTLSVYKSSIVYMVE